jgi:hypothetical protein
MTEQAYLLSLACAADMKSAAEHNQQRGDGQSAQQENEQAQQQNSDSQSENLTAASIA